jgi:S-(hydroxymethyl)glutathione dehydrogenase/alcohol dehydrogenase
MPETTRAAILVESHAPLVVDTIELPETLAYGQVRVRVHMASICGSQLGEIAARKGPDRWLPHLLGHEGVGVVEAVGEGVRRVAPGDRVVLHWRQAPGLLGPLPDYRWRGGKLNAGHVTTFNQHAVVSETRVTPLPDDIDAAVGCLLGCALTTGLGVVQRDARLQIGETLLVLGAGSVGQCVVVGGRLRGAHPIVAVDRVSRRLDVARQLGASETVAGDDDSAALEAQLRSIIQDAGADVVVETTGHPALIALAHRLTSASGGRTVLVGVPPAGVEIPLATLPLHFGQHLTGSHGGDTAPATDIPRYLKLIGTGALDPSPLIERRFPLEDINDALDAMRSGEVTKAFLDLT